MQAGLAIAQSQEVKFLLDTTIQIMKTNAVNASGINWRVLKKSALKKARNINNPYELGPTIRYLYKSINDFHGQFFYRDSSFRWVPDATPTSDSIRNEWTKGVKSKTEILDNGIGYLRIPGMSAYTKEEIDKKAQSLNDSLCKLLTKGVRAIVLDLRLNGGGTMFPMMLGLKHLLPQGQLGSFQTKIEEKWILKETAFFIDDSLISNILPNCDINAQAMPVVLLTSPATGSSGEFLIISFKGRANTILLGTTTAGYVTVNNGMRINEMTSMNLSVGYGVDKLGNVYKEAIKPDISLVAVDKFNDIKNDEKVKAASNWLMNHLN